MAASQDKLVDDVSDALECRGIQLSKLFFSCQTLLYIMSMNAVIGDICLKETPDFHVCLTPQELGV